MVVTRASLASGSTNTLSETVHLDDKSENVGATRKSQHTPALSKLANVIFLKQSVHKIVARTRRLSAGKRRGSSGILAGVVPSAEKRRGSSGMHFGAAASAEKRRGSSGASPNSKPSAIQNSSHSPSHRESLSQAVDPQKSHPPAEQNRRISSAGEEDDHSGSKAAGRRRSHLVQINFAGGHFSGMKEPVHHHAPHHHHDAFRDLMVVARTKRAGRLFLRLGGPGARVEFLKEHPFFQGTSQTLRERLAPQLVRRSVEHATSEVLRQGEQPGESTDYLFLTSPDFNAGIEVVLDGHAVAHLCGGVVFGQEAVFHITNTFLFGIRVAADAVQHLWVIPRKTLQKLLTQDAFKDDAQLLAKRAHRNTISILRAWYLHPISHIKLRLFDNADYTFRQSLVQLIDMKLCAGGTTVCREGEDWTDAIFVFRGEAQVKIGGVKVCRLAHTYGMNAWAAWWGILEAVGTSQKSTASIEAVTDCIVWQLSPAALTQLRQTFPIECRLFDKVAKEHLKLLRSYAINLQESCLSKCDSYFLKTLDARCENRIYHAGDVVIRENDTKTDEIFIIIRGRVEVRKALTETGARAKPSSDDSKNGEGVLVARLTDGEWFGEVAALGVRETRTANVICTTLCDIRVLTRASILEALVRFPDQGIHLEALAEQHGYTQKQVDTLPNLVGLPFFSAFSFQFLESLAAEMTSFSAFKLQHVIDQRHQAKGMFVLLQGKVALLMDDALVHEIKAPGVVGEFSLVDPSAKSHFTVRCQCLCHFKIITPAAAKMVFNKFPDDEMGIGDLIAENLETIRSVLLRRFHGLNLSSVAKKQSNGVDEGEWESEGKPHWWSDTLFQASEARFLEHLSRHINKAIFFPDEVMIQEGDEGDFALVILAGEGVVEVGGMRVGEVKVGSLVGEATLIGNISRRTATVRAVDLVSVCVLARSVFVEALEEFPVEMERVQELILLRKSANKILKSGMNSGGQTSGHASGNVFGRSPTSVFGGLFPGGSGKPSPMRSAFAQALVDSTRETMTSSRVGNEEKPLQEIQSDKAGSRRPSFAINPEGRRASRIVVAPTPPESRRGSTRLMFKEKGALNVSVGGGAVMTVPSTVKRRHSFLPALASAVEDHGHGESDAIEDQVPSPCATPKHAEGTRMASSEMAPLSVIHRPRSASFRMLPLNCRDEDTDEDEVKDGEKSTPSSKLFVPGNAPMACVSESSSEYTDSTGTQFSRMTLMLPAGVGVNRESRNERSSSSSSKDSGSSKSSALSDVSLPESAEKPCGENVSALATPTSHSASRSPPNHSLASEPVEELPDWRSNLIQKGGLKTGMDLRRNMELLEPGSEYVKEASPDSSDDSDSESSSRSETSQAYSVVAPLKFCEALLHGVAKPSVGESVWKPRETAVEWAERRKIAIEAAPVRKAGRLIKKGNLLPLVPTSCGCVGGWVRTVGPQSNARARNLHASHAMSTAPRVYARARRFDDQCAVMFKFARCGNM